MPAIARIVTAPFRLFAWMGAFAARRLGGLVLKKATAKGIERATGARPPTVAEAAHMPLAKGVAVAIALGALGALGRMLVGRLMRSDDD